jgi:F0F1-type ATP synthase delta subunit
MRISASQYAKTLTELSKGNPADVGAVAGAFLSMLRRKRDLRKWPTILRMSAKMADSETGKLSLLAETARPVDGDERRKMETLAGGLFPGHELVVRYAVREDLLGGVRLSSDDEMVDATIRTRLRELEARMRV